MVFDYFLKVQKIAQALILRSIDLTMRLDNFCDDFSLYCGEDPPLAMNRRTYCQLTSMAFLGIYIPLTGCSSPNSDIKDNLSLPYTLATISDPSTIEALGKEYLKMTPAENDANMLMDILLLDADNNVIPRNADSLELKELLQQKVHSDFEGGNTVIVSGWVLSVTEARQCALFSLTQDN
jgi:hypothetical protein